ncbi:formyltransferase family protein [Glaciecola petra]|uniref:Formyltransferase family protein n=1 Tax=Glaciecola petra TaxID=3075602 RepID=A0ABU2ZN15_9ALTE|nr:formyltransferase family protein [Aestuariibacter sp. P117]MDT0593651.1 formyltransferase family protein [Aestuariibacter sp. P117]
MGKRAIILCSSIEHPVYPYLLQWQQNNELGKQVSIINDKAQISAGTEFLFLVSCSQIINADLRAKFKHVLVLHASDLPRGRGWSPHIWDVLAGKDNITISLLEAQDQVDTGDIWRKISIPLSGTELYDEINHLLFESELELIEWALNNAEYVQPQSQAIAINEGEDDLAMQASYYPKRIPEDSLIDIDKSIAEQFDLLRVCDPQRFPAYFDYKGQRYTLAIKKTTQD